MNILVTVGVLTNPGGVSALYKMLNLQNRGLAQYFHIFNPKKEKGILKKILRAIRKYIAFNQEIKNYKYIIINPSLVRNSFLRDSLFVLLGKWNKKKIIVFWHGWQVEYENILKKNILLNFIFRKTFARADGFIILGNIFKERLINMSIPENKKFLLFFNAADNYLLKDTKIDKCLSINSEIKILYISRFEKNKGMYNAIDIYIKLKTRYSKLKIKLILAGNGSEFNQVKQYIENKKVKDIELPGYINGQIKHEFLLNADLFLFPTQYGEGIPLSILEGMMYGLPIVTSDAGGIPDIIKNEVNGFVIHQNSENMIGNYCDKIHRLISNFELYKNISKNNIGFANNNITPNRASDILIDFIKTI